MFWNQIFLDEEYNRTFFIDELHFESWRVLRSETRGNEVHRVIEAVPQLGDSPAPLKKLLSSGAGYEERGVVDLKAHRYRLEVTPRSLANKLTIQGELFTTPAGEGSCLRTYVGKIEARIFGLGGLLEDRLLSDIERSYAKAAVFTNRWIAERLAGGARPAPRAPGERSACGLELGLLGPRLARSFGSFRARAWPCHSSCRTSREGRADAARDSRRGAPGSPRPCPACRASSTAPTSLSRVPNSCFARLRAACSLRSLALLTLARPLFWFTRSSQSASVVSACTALMSLALSPKLAFDLL